MKNQLLFSTPARFWEETIPLGNGKLGACVYGGVNKEKISLNYDELWSGLPQKQKNSDAYIAFEKARELALTGKLYQAQKQIEKNFTGTDSAVYLPMGDLLIDFPSGQYKSYSRKLNIDDAIAELQYHINKIQYQRKYLISSPDHCLAVQLKASKKTSISFSLRLHSQLKYKTGFQDSVYYLEGECPTFKENNSNFNKNTIHSDFNNFSTHGIRFRICVRVKTDGGFFSVTEKGISVSQANSAWIYLSCESSFNGYNQDPFLNGKDYQKLPMENVCLAAIKGFENIEKSHKEDYHFYYNRVSFSLEGEDRSNLPTNTRLLLHQKDGRDIGLYPLLFHYARYLTICASRENSQPMNLQGIWNHHLTPPWNSNYTLNINTEMNYFPTLCFGLPEMLKPLIKMIEEIAENGEQTAKNFYHAKGFCCHHNTDLWRMTNPSSGNAEWSFWPNAGGWLCRPLFEYYEYTNDLTYLKNTAYPLMKKSAEFYLSLLSELDGFLVLSPSTSPENRFSKAGKIVSVSETTQMTMQIIRDLFENLIKTENLLQEQSEIVNQIRHVLPHLLPIQIAKDGRIKEWYQEEKELEIHHRHISHLYALYPAGQISTDQTPSLAEAARKTLDARGDNGTGWSLGWKACCRARLGDGNHALRLLDLQLRPVIPGKFIRRKHGGGTYPNLLDAHPPFQIDGNFGAAASICEMLLQSDGKIIKLLPALPDAWKSGSVSGLCAQGNIKVDMKWKNGKLIHYRIHGGTGNETILLPLR